MRRLLLLAALFCAICCAPAAQAEPVTGGPNPLHVGDRGQRVKDLQWLLTGHKPSVYRTTVRYELAVDGIYGPGTRRAVRAAKWRLGYPKAEVYGFLAGRQLVEILTGKRARPLGWIGLASKRVHGAVAGVKSACDLRVIAAARSQLGVHEVPMGSNDGARVRVFQAVTGAFRLPWCASFVQWDLKTARYGTIAGGAGVFAIVAAAHARTLVHALPRPGALVAYLSNLGHIGIVERVTKRGFYSIEGNSSDAVRRRWHATGWSRTVFIWLPGC